MKMNFAGKMLIAILMMAAIAVPVFGQKTTSFETRATTRIDSADPDKCIYSDWAHDVGNRHGMLSRTLISITAEDIAKIPEKAKIVKAEMKVQPHSQLYSTPLTLNLFEVTKDFDVTKATWNSPKDGETWDGGEYDKTKRAAFAVIKTQEELGKWLSFDVTSMVQAWVNSPGKSRGLIMVDPAEKDGGAFSYIRFQRGVPVKFEVTYE
ncbi:MAG: DNRLRE domain-containing protein [Victivallales bacterium]|nr:DNRLRE domain-containing protein [Victivallales bacterium]